MGTVILVGKMGSGKTTLAMAMEEIGYERVVTCTSRPPREGEVDGVDYHFLDMHEFFDRADEFAERSAYGEGEDEWLYGSYLKDYTGDAPKVVVLNPEGAASVCAQCEDNGKRMPLVVWLDPPDYISLARVLGRGDDPQEIRRRMQTEELQFKRFEHLNLPNVVRIWSAYPPKDLAFMIAKMEE